MAVASFELVQLGRAQPAVLQQHVPRPFEHACAAAFAAASDACPSCVGTCCPACARSASASAAASSRYGWGGSWPFHQKRVAGCGERFEGLALESVDLALVELDHVGTLEGTMKQQGKAMAKETKKLAASAAAFWRRSRQLLASVWRLLALRLASCCCGRCCCSGLHSQSHFSCRMVA